MAAHYPSPHSQRTEWLDSQEEDEVGRVAWGQLPPLRAPVFSSPMLCPLGPGQAWPLGEKNVLCGCNRLVAKVALILHMHTSIHAFCNDILQFFSSRIGVYPLVPPPPICFGQQNIVEVMV